MPALLVYPAYPDKPAHRVYGTIAPLADRLALTIHQLGAVDDPKLVLHHAMKGDHQVLLLCLEHHQLPHAATLVPSDDAVPTDWPGDRIDVGW